MAQGSADVDFWEQRYQRAQLPWDSAGLPPQFADEAGTLLQAGVQRVLLPGCGSGYELLPLLAHGCQVLACDFSPAAIQRAQQLHPAVADCFVCADFFALDEQTGWDWVYERAFLCALPPALRQQYAAKMAALIPAGGVLAGYFFLGGQRGGPPYAITTEAVSALLAPYFFLERCVAVSASLPVFADGERWMVWRRLGV